MKPPTLSTRKIGPYVHARRPFDTHGNLYARWRGDIHPDRYIVWSYGTHWPLLVWDRQVNKWYGNKDKYSSTTSRHHTYACQCITVDEWYDCATLRAIAEYGIVRVVAFKFPQSQAA